MHHPDDEQPSIQKRTACERIAAKVMPTAEWFAIHNDHGVKAFEPFPHPSGKWFTLVCPCGAKHLTMTDDETSGSSGTAIPPAVNAAPRGATPGQPRDNPD